MDSEKILEELGLSKNEAKTYLCLLKTGACAAGEIAKKSKLHRSNVYDALERLQKKGLVGHITKEDTKIYQASNPNTLLTMLKEKEIELKTMLPNLILNYELSDKNLNTRIQEGRQAIRNMLNKLLEYKKTIYVYGIPKDAADQVGIGFMKEYHIKRDKEKINMLHIYNEDARSRIHYLNQLSYTEAKYLPPEYDSPVSTFICGDCVVLALITSNPTLVFIENQALATAYMKYFDLFWKVAKKE